MLKKVLQVIIIITVLFLFNSSHTFAQDTLPKRDSFFLLKSKGLLRRLGKSISVDPPGPEPVKVANPFLAHAGKTIRDIQILSLGFERSIYDTTIVRNTFGVIVANAFHKNTREKIITNNLFFREGNKINPYLLADNERHLRSLVYIKDARILLVPVPGSTDLVDVLVITKDVFSIGGNINISGVKRETVGIKEENFGGSGSKIAATTFYERDRNPHFGYGAEMINRNMTGSFIDWTVGFQNFRTAFSSARNQETYIYTHLERPLVTLYIPWIGGADFSYSKTNNLYVKDSLYNNDFNYAYYNADAWYGYNFGSKKLLSANVSNRVRKFIALRGFAQRFNEFPIKNQLIYDYRYANISGALLALSVFKQDFYRTNFIYGFGINEDVPQGFSASLIGGLTDKQDRTRMYYGIDAQRSHFNSNGFYSTYTFRFGSYSYKNRFEDIDLLFGIDHFTRLKKINATGLNRNFYSASFTRQTRPVLNEPLFLQSMFGLLYYDNTNIKADFRGTLKGETVFYDLHKYYGFRIAPFLFGDMSVVRPVNQPYGKSDLYSAWGGGIRTRNENLIFGTIELKGYFFPRPIGYMKTYKIELSTGIRFRYNNTFIRKPDFVLPN